MMIFNSKTRKFVKTLTLKEFEEMGRIKIQNANQIQRFILDHLVMSTIDDTTFDIVPRRSFLQRDWESLQLATLINNKDRYYQVNNTILLINPTEQEQYYVRTVCKYCWSIDSDKYIMARGVEDTNAIKKLESGEWRLYMKGRVQ